MGRGVRRGCKSLIPKPRTCTGFLDGVKLLTLFVRIYSINKKAQMAAKGKVVKADSKYTGRKRRPAF